MTRRTLVAASGSEFEGLLTDVSVNYLEQRGQAEREARRNLMQAMFLATYYAHHEMVSDNPSLRGDIAYMPMFMRGLRAAAEQIDVPVPAVCQVTQPYSDHDRGILLSTSRQIRISTAQTLVGIATGEALTCNDTKGHEYFAQAFRSGKTDPSRKAELVRVIREGDFTIPLIGESA